MGRMLPLVLMASIALAAQPAAATAAAPAAAAFTLPDMRGLIEGIAFRPKTGAYYLGDVHLRCVWLRTADGRVTRFSAPDDRLLGVFRVAVDEARGALWVSIGALAQMDGFDEQHKGASGLAELDLATGAVRRVVMVPADGAPHLLGDFVQLPDGTIYATDETSPVIWTLAPGRSALAPFLTGAFKSLQGITLDADGRGLFVTDYGAGVLHVDLPTKAVRPLTAPAEADRAGSTRCCGRRTAPSWPSSTPRRASASCASRSMRPRPQSPGVDVLAADPAIADANLGTLVGGDLVFIADGGWNRFEPGKVDTSPRPVPVWKVPWAAPRR